MRDRGGGFGSLSTVASRTQFHAFSHYEDLGKDLPTPDLASGEPLHTRVRIGTNRLPNPARDTIFGTNFSSTFPTNIFGEELDSYGPKKRPLVFVPGIMGSTVEEVIPNGLPKQLWPPIHTAANGTMELGDPLELVDKQNKKPTGLVPFVYDGLLACLTADPPVGPGYKIGESLFIFPYDWTRSNQDSGRKLAGFINEVIAQWNGEHPESPVSKVDIINHSMGGIVSRVAMIFFQAPVERTIYLASPHYGAPKAYFILKDNIPIRLIQDNWFFEKAISLAVQAVTGVDVDALKRNLRRTAQGLPSVYELLPDQYWFDREQWLVNIDDSPFGCSFSEGPISGGWQATYLADKFYSLADNGAQRSQVVSAMELKRHLGPNLPGNINLILYNRDHDTRNKAGFDIELFTPCFPDYNDTSEKLTPGDETVPEISARGPEPALYSVGSHTALPNSEATCYHVKRFLVESTLP